MAMQGGGKRRYVDARSIISPKPFVRGFKEVKQGIPMDYDAYYDDVNSRERYERGRMFGYIFHGTLKIGKKVTNEARHALTDAYYNGSLI